jgi:hypothetical protein
VVKINDHRVRPGPGGGHVEVHFQRDFLHGTVDYIFVLWNGACCFGGEHIEWVALERCKIPSPNRERGNKHEAQDQPQETAQVNYG